MMDTDERLVALASMSQATDQFYRAAVGIGNHPFIEFAGLMREYINACWRAHEDGIDFSECNRHTGMALPMEPVMSDYVNEKLACIYAGSKVLDARAAHQTDHRSVHGACAPTRLV
ncbi:hypothetical protein [Pseudorhodoferax sp. Leaf267]|uniref:hypothetical protein n=1 Tax=Pseudorhodoferax sp. Leaf267 TaxID=1736316 RepID=UPI0006F74FBA|nr:hypothetical protein [Pseudorhodoferax sp. Leaf267]KQP15163.1 hypothetical protein ASF43_14155 [Pseudorhodoferax sp. Leaf267]